MSVNVNKIRKAVEAEGFVAPADDKATTHMAFGLRLAPALCMTWTVIGIMLAEPMVLWALIPFALLGAILPNHPFDIIYNFGLRHLFGAARLPHYPSGRRIVCMTATVMLFVISWGFYSGIPAVSYAFGGMMIASATLYVTSGLCVITFFLQPRAYVQQITQ